jgi:hypothetical protein
MKVNHCQYKWILLIVVLCGLHAQSIAQGSDMIVLKKGKNKTLKTWLAYSQVHFITIAGNEVRGTVKKIEKDSLFIQIYDERKNYTPWGTSFWDTIAIGLSRYHYKEIREVIKPQRGFGFIRNGFLFIMGGTAYALLHSINGLYLKQPLDPVTMGISGGAVASGLILQKIHRRTVTLGKRYHLQYIPVK